MLTGSQRLPMIYYSKLSNKIMSQVIIVYVEVLYLKRMENLLDA